MRFAEHMLLEAKVHGLTPYTRRDENDNRCALGLVEGDTPIRMYAEFKYPWICVEAVYPCKCIDLLPCRRVMAIIAHLFNEHVMHGVTTSSVPIKTRPDAEPWTLERLADWIESVDPTPRVAESTPELTGTEMEIPQQEDSMLKA
jgi:hypothetical protein